MTEHERHRRNLVDALDRERADNARLRRCGLEENEIREAIQKAYREWTLAVEGRSSVLAHNLVTLMTCHILDIQNSKREAAQSAE
jgi:hypothetical protein